MRAPCSWPATGTGSRCSSATRRRRHAPAEAWDDVGAARCQPVPAPARVHAPVHAGCSRPSCPTSTMRWSTPARRGLNRLLALPEAVTGGYRPGDERFDSVTARRPFVEADVRPVPPPPSPAWRSAEASPSVASSPSTAADVPVHVAGVVTDTRGADRRRPRRRCRRPPVGAARPARGGGCRPSRRVASRERVRLLRPRLPQRRRHRVPPLLGATDHPLRLGLGGHARRRGGHVVDRPRRQRQGRGDAQGARASTSGSASCAATPCPRTGSTPSRSGRHRRDRQARGSRAAGSWSTGGRSPRASSTVADADACDRPFARPRRRRSGCSTPAAFATCCARSARDQPLELVHRWDECTAREVMPLVDDTLRDVGAPAGADRGADRRRALRAGGSRRGGSPSRWPRRPVPIPELLRALVDVGGTARPGAEVAARPGVARAGRRRAASPAAARPGPRAPSCCSLRR